MSTVRCSDTCRRGISPLSERSTVAQASRIRRPNSSLNEGTSQVGIDEQHAAVPARGASGQVDDGERFPLVRQRARDYQRFEPLFDLNVVNRTGQPAVLLDREWCRPFADHELSFEGDRKRPKLTRAVGSRCDDGRGWPSIGNFCRNAGQPTLARITVKYALVGVFQALCKHCAFRLWNITHGPSPRSNSAHCSSPGSTCTSRLRPLALNMLNLARQRPEPLFPTSRPGALA